MNYIPRPLNTVNLHLPREIEGLIEYLAANNHEIWAQRRIADGWKYGPQRNDEKKEHPDLVPYEQLPDPEKDYDRATATGIIKTILALGYEIRKKL